MITARRSERPDVVVVGGGAIGFATTLHLAKQGVSVLMLEKEEEPALHQSGRNSGVIHAGYNLKPGSTKARYCVEGSRRLRAYCAERGVPMVQGGILVVATSDDKLPVLAELKRRSDANGVAAQLVDPHEIRMIEPFARGLGGLHAPEGASFDSHTFVRTVAEDAGSAGARIRYGVRVGQVMEQSSSARRGISLRTSSGTIETAAVVNCAGLHADRLAGPHAQGLRIIPFRGYYAELKPRRRNLVRSHIYAAPDLAFPFLGVHASCRADGRVLLGPGAMLAFGREAYALYRGNPRDLIETLAWPGFHNLLGQARFRRLILSELKKSLSLRAIWHEARGLIPALDHGDLVRSFAGNRAQLVTRDGSLVEDILIRETDRALHVLNAVSPGLTCSLPFGQHLAERCLRKLDARGGTTSPPAIEPAIVPLASRG